MTCSPLVRSFHLLVYTSKWLENGAIRRATCRSVIFQRGEDQIDPAAPQHFFGAVLGAAPGRRDSFQQLASRGCGCERRATLIAVVRHFLDPAVLEHHR